MKTIWKFPFVINDEINFYRIPRGGEVIHVDLQDGIPTIWVLVDPSQPDGDRRIFKIFGTGHPIDDPENLKFIGTFQQHSFVWHLFELEIK